MYNQNCDYNKPSCNCNKSNTSDNCCIKGIQLTLETIKKCVYSISNMPGFGVTIEITLSTGFKYTLSINSGVLNTICIDNKVAKFGDTTISLCDIAKIKILSSNINNPNFIKCLNHKLSSIIKDCGHDCHCSRDYLAIDFDDDDDVEYSYYRGKNIK